MRRIPISWFCLSLMSASMPVLEFIIFNCSSRKFFGVIAGELCCIRTPYFPWGMSLRNQYIPPPFLVANSVARGYWRRNCIVLLPCTSMRDDRLQRTGGSISSGPGSARCSRCIVTQRYSKLCPARWTSYAKIYQSKFVCDWGCA